EVCLLERGAVFLKGERQEYDLVGPAERKPVSLGCVIGEDADSRSVGCDLIHERVAQHRRVKRHRADTRGQSAGYLVNVKGLLVVLGLTPIPRDVEIVRYER